MLGRDTTGQGRDMFVIILKATNKQGSSGIGDDIWDIKLTNIKLKTSHNIQKLLHRLDNTVGISNFKIVGSFYEVFMYNDWIMHFLTVQMVGKQFHNQKYFIAALLDHFKSFLDFVQSFLIIYVLLWIKENSGSFSGHTKRQ